MYQTIPPRVDYELTELGRKLMGAASIALRLGIVRQDTDSTRIDMYSIYINVNESQEQQLRPGFIRAGEVYRSTF